MIPVTIIDDYFENPDMIVEYANSLKYSKDTKGRWPGVRSEPLHLINKDFFKKFCDKLFSIHFNIADPNISWKVSLMFQKIDSTYKDGWVHQDKNMLYTVIVYLNKNYNLDSGTSLMTKKVLLPEFDTIQNFAHSLPEDQVKDIREEINNQYEESISLKNRYNRLIAFPSYMYHKAQSFENNEERLTLIAFVEKLYVSETPLTRIKNTIL